MADYKIYVEEKLNKQFALQNRNMIDTDCLHYIRSVAKILDEKEETSLYEDVCTYLARINNDNDTSTEKFIKKSGKLDEKKFYDYAQIGKNTWSNIRLNAKGITKESALKLVIALQLNEEEAKVILKKASWSFNPNDDRDNVILALLHRKCFVPKDAARILESYANTQKEGETICLFENIYDVKKL